MENYDIVVVGGGPIGLATGWRAAARGLRAVVLDRHGFFNERGGSSGAERHWRLQYTQEDLFRLTLAARPLWRELESQAERTLIHHIGSLWFGDIDVDTNEGRIGDTARVMDKLDVGYEWLGASDIERRFGFAALPGHYEGFLQPDGGTIDVKGTIGALYGLGTQAGCAYRDGERVLAVEPDADGVTVRGERATYRASKVVLAAGGSTNDLLAPLGVELDIKLYEMPLVTMRRRAEQVDFPFWFVFQQPTEEDTNLFYGFGRNPWTSNGLLRVGSVFEVNPLDRADDATGRPDPRHVQRVGEWIARHVPSLDPTPAYTSACLAALPGDLERQFHLGTVEHLVPHGENLVVYSSGWGFKFVPLLGRICVDLAVDGRTPYDITRLSPSALRKARP